MILPVAREAIAEQFAIGWAVLHPTMPYCFDNEEFTPPDGGSWVRVSVQMQAASQDSLGPVGSRKFLRSGTAFVQVFVDKDSGLKPSDDLAQDVVTILEGIDLGGSELRLYTASVRDIGNDGRWHQTNVSVAFDYQETR